jgi:hypothetical protein
MFGNMIFTIGLTIKQKEINMWIYNFLFYKTFLLTQKSRNFDDTPVLGGILFIILCVMLNIFTILGFFDAIGFLKSIGLKTGITFSKPYRFPFALALVVLLLFYYQYKGRYKKIIEHYEGKTGFIMRLHPLIVILIYVVSSFLLLLIVAAFKNHDWFFAP